MPRKANQADLQALQNAIEKHPGQRVGFFSRLLKWRHEEVSRRLVSLNDQGVLLWEDDHGRLWPFGKK